MKSAGRPKLFLFLYMPGLAICRNFRTKQNVAFQIDFRTKRTKQIWNQNYY
jgi:hypothetical protein